MEEFGGSRHGFLEGSIKTYGKAIRLISEVYHRVTGSEMPALPGSPRERYAEALQLLESEWQKSKQDQSVQKELHEVSEPDHDLQQFLDETFEGDDTSAPPDIDDVSPNTFKAAFYRYVEECLDEEEVVDVMLDEVLRWIATQLKGELGWSKRINVGANRHFPRMLQWIRELENDTWWDEGRGVRLMNASGRGAVASEPHSPKTLKLRIDPNFL